MRKTVFRTMKHGLSEVKGLSLIGRRRKNKRRNRTKALTDNELKQLTHNRFFR